MSDRSGSKEAERTQWSEGTKPEVTKLSEAWMPKQRRPGQVEAAQARKETCFLFQAHGHGHDRLLFWRKLQWKKFWMEGNRHQQSEPAGHRHGPELKDRHRHRLRGDAKKHVFSPKWRSRETEQQAASGRGSNKEHNIYIFTTRKRLFCQQKFKGPRAPLGWATNREARSHRSATTKLSGAQMPEQRRLDR